MKIFFINGLLFSFFKSIANLKSFSVFNGTCLEFQLCLPCASLDKELVCHLTTSFTFRNFTNNLAKSMSPECIEMSWLKNISAFVKAILFKIERNLAINWRQFLAFFPFHSKVQPQQIFAPDYQLDRCFFFRNKPSWCGRKAIPR